MNSYSKFAFTTTLSLESRFVTREDDVDLVVRVLRIAVVVRHPSALGLAEFGQAEDAKRAAGDLVVDADLGEQDG